MNESEQEKQFEQRLKYLRDRGKKIRNGQQKKRRDSVVRRLEIINAVFGDSIVDMNDSDIMMIVLLLSKHSFQHVRKMLYRVAETMEINKKI